MTEGEATTTTPAQDPPATTTATEEAPVEQTKAAEAAPAQAKVEVAETSGDVLLQSEEAPKKKEKKGFTLPKVSFNPSVSPARFS